jgi:hypothetical protein
MINIGKLVIQYVNEHVAIGDELTRKGLLKYIALKEAESAGYKDPDKYKLPDGYTTVDTYRRVLQLNNILGESVNGKYIKYHDIPEGETIGTLRKRIVTGTELFKRFSIMTAWKEGNDI